jgi:hypothetical protein
MGYAPPHRRSDIRALAAHIDFARCSHFQPRVEQHVTEVDQIPLCTRDHSLGGHSHRFVNRQRNSHLRVAAIEAVAGLHIPQSPMERH